MKKTIAILLLLVTVLSLAACGETGTTDIETPEHEERAESSPASAPAETEESEQAEEIKATKEEMLASATPVKREDIKKSIDNMAFAKSLIGNVYTFDGEIYSVEEDHAVITFYIDDEDGAYATAANVMVGRLYLPTDELISLEAKQRLSFVGILDDVDSHEETVPDWGTDTVIDMLFHNCAITGDRFEKTGKLFSKNANYGEDAWDVVPVGSNVAYIVYFRDDVSSYKGKTITFSCKITGKGCEDAYIIE